MCPKGKGFVPIGEYSYDVGGENYKGENQVVMNFQDMCPIRHSSKSMAWIRQNQSYYKSWKLITKPLILPLDESSYGLWTEPCVAWELEYLRLGDGGMSLNFFSFHLCDRNNVSKVTG